MERLILTVDDREDDRLLIIFMLDRLGYRSISAADGASGLQLAQTYQPALVLLDICMPVMGGCEVLRHLKQTSETAAIPVIAVTAMEMNIQKQILEAGFSDYLLKPFSVELLKQSIDRHLANTARSSFMT